MEREVFNLKEVGLAIGRKRTAVYELINSGELPARRMGGRIVVLKDDLKRWLHSRPLVTPPVQAKNLTLVDMP